MAEIKKLSDPFGVLHAANKILPDDKHRIACLSAVAELEDNSCHKRRTFPVTRLHRVKGVQQAIYRADIDKVSGWRLHIQYDKANDQLVLKDIVEGQDHDAVIRVIKSKKNRYD